MSTDAGEKPRKAPGAGPRAPHPGCPKTECTYPSCVCNLQQIPPMIAKREILPVPEMLEQMAKTFRERSAQYKDNWKMVGRVMAVLFPDGVQMRVAEDYDVWHLFELIIVKTTRFANGELAHQDSIHDIAVYAAMIETILKQREKA